MATTKERKPVWYVKKIEELTAEIESLKTDLILNAVNKPIVPQMISGYSDDRPIGKLEAEILEHNASAAENDSPPKWRNLLATLPMPGVRLLVALQGALAHKPGFRAVPLAEFDGLDFWTASHYDSNMDGDPRIIKLTLSKEHQLVAQAKERYEAAYKLWSANNNLMKAAHKAWESEPNESQAKEQYARKVAEYSLIVDNNEAIMKQNEGAEYHEQTWEIPFLETV